MRKILFVVLLMLFWSTGQVMAVEPVWQKMEGSDMPESIGSYYGVAYDEGHDRVFVVGGYTAISGSIGTTGAYVGQFGVDGKISWRRLPNFPVPVQGNFSYFDNLRNKLVVVGGNGNGNIYNTVYVLSIDSATGDAVGNWNYDPLLPMRRHFMAGLVYGGKVFIFGGRDSYNVGVNTIFSRTLGTYSEWKMESSRLPYWGDSMGVAVGNGFIYVGGAQQENPQIQTSCQTGKVYMAPISADGVIGSWVQTTGYPTSEHSYFENTVRPVLPIKSYHQMRVYGGYVYVGPGTAYNEFNNNGCPEATKYDPDVVLSATMRTYRAQILADGKLGSWEQFGTGDLQQSRAFDMQDWQLGGYGSNVYGMFLKGSKLYQVGGMNYAGMSKAVYSLDLSGQGGSSPTTTPTMPAVITPACVGSSGGGIVNANGSVTITMIGNVAVDSGELHVFNREYLVSGIPQRVKFGGTPVSITNGVKSADGKTISFQVRYSDLNRPDSNFNNSYLYQLQFNGVLKKGATTTGYDGNCVKWARLEPRPGTVAVTSTPIPTNTPIPVVGMAACAVGVPVKSLGNANCDGGINILDFEVWYGEYQKHRNGQTQAGGWKADFNNDGKPDLTDLGVWKVEWGK